MSQSYLICGCTRGKPLVLHSASLPRASFALSARARRDDAKLVRSWDAPCNTKGLPRVQPQMRYDWLITSLKREGYRSLLKYFWKEKFWKVRVTSEQAPLSTWFFQPRQEMNSNLIVDLLACS